MARVQPLTAGLLESICKVLGDELTNPEITQYLLDSGIANIDPVNTKWKRLYNAFIGFQTKNQCSNNILTFISKSLSPIRYIGKIESFENIRTEINKRLIFIGHQYSHSGSFSIINAAKTISDAEKRAGDLKYRLKERNVHPDVLLFCKAELLQENYFHAVFEATKSIADKIRFKTGFSEDGGILVDKAFGLGQSNLAILSLNSLNTESEKSEHKGLMNLLKGVFGMFRNTTAHIPKIKWDIDEADALDALTIISLLHRKLDQCIKSPSATTLDE